MRAVLGGRAEVLRAGCWVRRTDVRRATCWVFAGVLTWLIAGAGTAYPQPPRFANAAVETRSAAQGVEREVRAVAARGTAAWIGYRVPMTPGRHRMCDARMTYVALEGSKEFFVLAKMEGGALVQLRSVTPDCEIDAGGMPIVWLDAVKPDDSVAWLTSVMSADPLSGDRRNRLGRKAIAAIAMHEAPSALRTLISAAREDQRADIRGQALFWLGQRAGDRALATISDAIDRDPETEVKKKAVFALSQLPKDESVPKLIEVARTNRNPAVRKQAMFWLGQSHDPRALAFFEEILLGARD